jgi:hypothetical protein
VKPDGFAADLYRKPEVLRRLAATLEAGNRGRRSSREASTEWC